MLTLWLAACAVGEWQAERDALDRWQEAMAAIEVGDPAAAARSLEDALAHDDAPLLRAWYAQTLAEAGSLPQAIEQLEQTLAAQPAFAVARYNLAAYLARSGQGDRAASELARALQDGAARPVEVFDDPDFDAWIGQPGWSFLPSEPVSVQARWSPDRVAVGDDVFYDVALRGLVEGPLHVVGPDDATDLALVRAVEHRTSGDDPSVTLRWHWRATRAGSARLGPVWLEVGGRRIKLPAAPIEVVDHPAPHNTAEVVRRWWIPSDWDGLSGPYGVRRNALWVRTPASIAPAASTPPSVVLEHEAPDTVPSQVHVWPRPSVDITIEVPGFAGFPSARLGWGPSGLVAERGTGR